jgi:hypothetical protein
MSIRTAKVSRSMSSFNWSSRRIAAFSACDVAA